MSLSALTCPHCVGSFLVDSTMAGQEALCPNCKGMVLIPAVDLGPPAAPPSVSAADATLQFGCPVCFQPFAALASMGGQQVMCPHCGSTVMVPQRPTVEEAIGPPPVMPMPPSVPETPPPVVSPSPPRSPSPPASPLPPVLEPARPSKPVPAPPEIKRTSTAPSSAANRPILAPAAASLEPPAAVADLPAPPAAAAEASATDTDRPIRKLSPEERARYRLIKNAVVLAICAVVLGALFLALRYAPILKELSGRVELRIEDRGLRIEG